MLIVQMTYIQEMDSKVSFKFNKFSKSRLEIILSLALVKLSGQACFARTQPFLARKISITSYLDIFNKLKFTI